MIFFENRLEKRRHLGNFRELQVVENLIDFSSNDYLGLARSQALKFSVLKEWEKCEEPLNGLGSTGSRLLTGNSQYVQDLEQQLAQFHGYEAGLLFNCGYVANLALLSTVATPDDVIFFDTQVHASTHDGIRLSRAQTIPFRHQDLMHLENRLKKSRCKGKRFICIEAIYSTNGSRSHLQEINYLAKSYDAYLIVDEAHSVGVWGHQGRGLVEENKLQGQVLAQITTFGKALGVYGAIIFCSHLLKQNLINFARPFIYSTALPFNVLSTIKCAYQILPTLEAERQHIQCLISCYRKTMPSTSGTQIQCIKVKGNLAVKFMANHLMRHGFDVRPLMSPTVRRGEEVLRICLHAFNQESQLKNLIQCIKLL